MSTRDEDELWRSIVENYGERPVLDDEPGAPTPRSPRPESPDDTPDGTVAGAGETPSRSPLLPGPEPAVAPTPQPRDDFVPFTDADPSSDASEGVGDEDGDDSGDVALDEPRFVPPTPPMPTMDRSRWIAWIAVLGSPLAFVLAALANLDLNGLLAAVLALGFVGGFGWLVWKMPKSPDDPWDDGARV